MNIDIEAFKIWFEKEHTDGTIGFNDRDEWYVSYAMILDFITYNLDKFNTGTLAESA